MEKSSFFNSVNGDRKYKASDFAEYFNSLVTNGVFPNPSTNLQVIANNNMTVTVKAGKAWINGYAYFNTGDLILNIDVADGVLNRIDRVVLRMDTVGRNITAKVKKGTFAGSPVAPTLQRNADAYELGIADIYINKGVVSVVQANITDLRMNTSVCGWVNSLIQADTTAIFNQYLDWYNSKTSQYQTDMSNMESQFQQQFNDWFNSIKITLGSDAAGNLLNQINNLAGTGRTTETVKGNADAIKSLQQDVASHKADDMKHIDYAVASGTNTYTATIANITALTEGLSVKIKFTNANTGASTLNINGLGAKSILKGNGNALSSGNIKAGQICHLVYTGSVFQLLGEGGEYGTVTASDVRSTKTFGTENGIVQGTLDLTNLIASNIINGITIGGVTGTALTFARPTPGDVELFVSVGTKSVKGTTNTKMKEIQISIPGTYRIKFDLMSDTPGQNAYGQVYVNDVARGILRSTTTTYGITYTEDLTLNTGDRVQIYGYGTNIYGSKVLNFKVCANVNPLGQINLD